MRPVRILERSAAGFCTRPLAKTRTPRVRPQCRPRLPGAELAREKSLPQLTPESSQATQTRPAQSTATAEWNCAEGSVVMAMSAPGLRPSKERRKTS